MPPRKKARTQTPKSPKSQWTKGDFELISNDGTSFRVPSYQLQAASKVFRDMIGAGSGEKRVEKRVELDEKSSTIDWFLHLTTGDVSFLDTLAQTPDWPGTLELLYFVKKYDSASAINQLRLYLRMASPHEWNAHLRILIAMHLDLTHELADVVESEPGIFKWLRPSSTSPHAELTPYDLFRIIPHRFLWALMTPDLFRPRKPVRYYDSGFNEEPLTPRERFLSLLSQTGESP